MIIKYASINGELVPLENASIPIMDIGLLRGYGIFDYLTLRQGKLLFLEDHLARFQQSAKLMELELPSDSSEIKDQIVALVGANGLLKSGVQLILTGGISENNFLPGKANLMLLQSELRHPAAELYEHGVKLIMHKYVREIPGIKTTNYIVPIRLSKAIKTANAFDVLYHNGTYISESARSNFFMVNANDEVLTSNLDILKGITRKNVIAAAKGTFELRETKVSLADLSAAKEAFMTSSTKGVLPVVQIDAHQIGNGKPGPITAKIQQLFNQHVNTYLAKQPVMI